MFEVTAQARAQVAAKSATPPHVAAAQAHQAYLRSEHGSAMGQHADRPPTDEEAERADAELEQDDDATKAVRQHPDSGRWMGAEETAFGAESPIMTALAQHRAPSPLATLQTAGVPAQASSIAPGEVRVQSLDYRGAMGPLAVNMAPTQPAPHTASNGPRP
jgi:hypothetical protein